MTLRIAALTMVYRDYWALSQWHAHHARLLGAENLYIVSHGNDPRHRELCPGSSLIGIPRDFGSEDFDFSRHRMLNHLIASLNECHDWVLTLDSDELLFSETPIPELLSDVSSNTVFALGLDLTEMPGDPEPGEGSALRWRKTVVASGTMSKCVAFRNGYGHQWHGFTPPRGGLIGRLQLWRNQVVLPEGLYLVHLKFAAPSLAQDSLARRKEMGEGHHGGLVVGSWIQPEQTQIRHVERVAGLEVLPWDVFVKAAHEKALGSVRRALRMKFVRIGPGPYPLRSELPQNFCETTRQPQSSGARND